MKKFIIALWALAQTACASLYQIPQPESSSGRYFGQGYYAHDRMEQAKKEDPELWEKVQKSVSDDKVIVEIYDKDGNLTATGIGR